MRDTIRKQLRKEKDRHYEAITKIVSENIGLNHKDTYFYRCQGSGYYLKFLEVSGETVIFTIYSKGGIRKDKKFYINWYGVSELEVYKAG